MYGFSVEHFWVIGLFLFFLLCNEFCKPKIERYYIPHLEYVLKSKGQKGTGLLKWIGIFCLLIALSSPVYKKGYVQSTKDSVDIALTLDLSGSMRYPITQQGQSRFEALQENVNDFIDKRKNDRIAIVSFASSAAVTSPLTFDKKIAKDMFKNQYIGVVGEKTAIYDALFQTYLLMDESDAKSKVVILFTDGVNNFGSTPKDVIKQIIEDSDIKLYIIGLGVVDRRALEEFATKGKGKFFSVNNKKDLKQVYSLIDNLEKSEVQSGTKVLKSYYYIFFLYLSLLSFLLYFYFNTQKGLK